MRLRAFLQRVTWLFRRDRLEREMDEEMRFHLENEIAERVAGGMSPAEARRTARRDFGGVDVHKDDARVVRGLRWVEDGARDARFALRSLTRSPGVALVAIGTLALGVGATTAIFGTVRGILLRPLPYAHPDRLAALWQVNLPLNRRQNVVSVANFEAWRKRVTTVETMAALVPDLKVLQRDRPERLTGAAVSPAWFEVIGVHPALGRGFTGREGAASERVVVLSDGLWREAFGADSAVIGRDVRFDDGRFTVVGVMPRGFDPPAFGWLGSTQQYWVPFTPTEQNRGWGPFLLVLGRVRAGVPLERAREQLVLVAGERAREDPANRRWSADLVGLREQVTGQVRPALLVLMVAVAGLLATTVVNIVNLLLARLRRRSGELALRLALGAGRGRLARQLVVESLAIGALAAPLGGLLAWLGVRGILAVRPADLPRAGDIRVDGVVLGFALIVTLGATLLAGTLPALRMPKPGLRDWLEAGGGGRGTARGLSGGLVVAEVALALMLTVAAGLAMRSFLALRAADLGFQADQVTTFRLFVPSERYDGPARRQFYLDLADRLRALPGVRDVGLASRRPLGISDVATTVLPADGRIDQADAPGTDVIWASPGYFRVLRIALVAGQIFDSTPAPGSEPAILISQTGARLLFGGGSAVGRAVDIHLNGGIRARVAGVVGDVAFSGPAVPVRPTVYFPDPVGGRMDVLVRSAAAPDVLQPLIRDAVWSEDRFVPVYDLVSMDRAVVESMGQDRVTFAVLAGFSVAALLLATAGVAGVLLVDVARRRRELGIRLALGAAPGRVRGGVVRSGLTLAMAGIAIGTAGALGLTRFMAAMLHGVTPLDWPTYLGVAGLIGLAALVATWIPARRATRVDPLEVLRTD
jgi:putative ABC transport system permease protein